VNEKTVDVKKEQKATLARPRYKYSLAARFFFGLMDMMTGSRATLAKTKLIEMLASIPYREWEFRQYIRMTRKYGSRDTVARARTIAEWGREAQDNEFWHLLVIHEKMEEEGIKDPWFLSFPVTFGMIASYSLMARFLALFNSKRAFLFNAEFEDHAEHVYAQFVEDNPAWEDQKVTSKLVRQYSSMDTWADVFRRIGLDERDHMNASFVFAGQADNVVRYTGMPDLPE
jgi:hypothetical protein